jgi:hypothetical protein
VQQHFVSLYDGGDPASLQLRRDYAFPVYGELSEAEARQLAAFYFWTAWGATTNRPGQTITYTSNWPHEPLVGNSPTTGTLLWSLASVILLLAAAGALIAYYAKQFDVWRGDILPEDGMATSDLLGQAVITPSMRATAKYFWVVCALFVTQVLLGIVTAHYAVEGKGSTACPSPNIFPTRSPAHGTRSSRCCGSPRRGWRPGSMSRRCSGTRPQIPAARRQLSVRQPSGHRHRLVRRAMGGGPSLLHQPDGEFLVRAPGL